MEGSGRSSTALLLLALMLAASSASAAVGAQRRQPPVVRSYKLITVGTSRGNKVRLAVRADVTSIAGFANGENDWFAIQGSEEAFRHRYGGGGNIPGHGVVNLLATMLKKNVTP